MHVLGRQRDPYLCFIPPCSTMDTGRTEGMHSTFSWKNTAALNVGDIVKPLFLDRHRHRDISTFQPSSTPMETRTPALNGRHYIIYGWFLCRLGGKAKGSSLPL